MPSKSDDQAHEGPDCSAPTANVAGYGMLYCLEVGLREFIIAVLREAVGPGWWKQRLPGDVLDKVKEARATYTGTPWFRYVELHPLHYVDFPDLLKLALRKDNWEDGLSQVFVHKAILEGMLSRLKPVRDSIAHNREISAADLEALSSSLGAVVHAVGDARFRELVTGCTHMQDSQRSLAALAQEVRNCRQAILALEELGPPSRWYAVRDEWWFDEEYVGDQVSCVQHFYGIVEEYRELPRSMGSGHKIEQWLAQRAFRDAAEHAVSFLSGSQREG